MFRAKVRVNRVIDDGYSDTIQMSPVITGASAEDNSYAKATPSGELSLSISNPNLRGKIKPGDVFYVDFAPAVPATPA